VCMAGDILVSDNCATHNAGDAMLWWPSVLKLRPTNKCTKKHFVWSGGMYKARNFPRLYPNRELLTGKEITHKKTAGCFFKAQ